MQYFLIGLIILLLTVTVKGATPEEYQQSNAMVSETKKVLLDCFYKKQEDKTSETIQPEVLHCYIEELKPLADSGNYIAAYSVAEFHAMLGRPEEAKQCLKTLLKRNDLPSKMREDAESRLEELNKETPQ